MRIEVLCFATTRDVIGKPQLALDVPADATVGVVLESLAERHPGLRPLLGRMRYAVNEEFAAVAQPLADGDRLALLPPMSGG
jgi:molybdopterin converting factor subunit 1